MSKVFSFPITGRVTCDWKVKYTDPLSVHKGDVVKLGPADPVWTGWQWCTDIRGKSGWVPISYIDRNNRDKCGKMLDEFTARELEIASGEEIKLHKFESDWYWASNKIGQEGWIPASCVRVVLSEIQLHGV